MAGLRVPVTYCAPHFTLLRRLHLIQDRKDRESHSGTAETVPLIVGIVGISIPVALLTLAATSESVVVLVFAVLSIMAVGAGTLAFVFRLAADPPEQLSGGDGHSL
jgi:hypothetical protein